MIQAEDGIRDWSVTGVQTCALPICFECNRDVLPTCDQDSSFRLTIIYFVGRVEQCSVWVNLVNRHPPDDHWLVCQLYIAANTPTNRSEERRVGKECRSR